ncbi:DUF4145 domain-containing protein [Clostridium beijerinckii]|uniref:DUF4145 domain-containing protein n=1 Tax=Clostridium beijerinckii TaxID=1520 RepID=UPI000304FCE1|nr:DUF4145 domain-containing protein [Clostridium beijerinckii]
MEYILPKYETNSFTCPYCGVLAEQKWDKMALYRQYENEYYRLIKPQWDGDYKMLSVSTCNSCHKEHIWFQEKMIVPKVANVPMPMEDMPEKVKEIYNEARDVFTDSPKASAALLRLALQHLCIELGEEGKNINNDIGKLVEKGLPVEIQKALDVVRVIGNNAVHPGTLDLNDNKENVAYLFNIINFIVDNQIVQKKKINELYNSLPQNSLKGIEKRDK